MQRELRYWWGHLTEDDVLRIAGRRDELLAVLHERYGYTRQQAQQELDFVIKRPAAR